MREQTSPRSQRSFFRSQPLSILQTNLLGLCLDAADAIEQGEGGSTFVVSTSKVYVIKALKLAGRIRF